MLNVSPLQLRGEEGGGGGENFANLIIETWMRFTRMDVFHAQKGPMVLYGIRSTTRKVKVFSTIIKAKISLFRH